MTIRPFPAVLLLVAVLSAPLSACLGDDRPDRVQSSPIGADEEATYEYEVPFGTGNRLDSGATIEIMPQNLDVRVGESIRIVNNDTRDYMIGPFFVMAGQTLAMRFTNKGVLRGVCEVNSSGEFTITVSD